MTTAVIAADMLKQVRKRKTLTNRYPGECCRCHARVAENDGEFFEGPLRLCCAACALREGVRDDNGFSARLAGLPRKSPEGKDLNLLPFQVQDCKRISATRNLLIGAAPGTGKTIMSIMGALRADAPNLIFCPASVRENWANEIAKWRSDLHVLQVDTQAAFAQQIRGHMNSPGSVLIGSFGVLPGSPCNGCRKLKVRLRELKKWKEDACPLCELPDGSTKEGFQRSIKLDGKCLTCDVPTIKIPKPRYRAPWYPACEHFPKSGVFEPGGDVSEWGHPPHVDLRIDGRHLRLPYHPTTASLSAWLECGVELPERGPVPGPEDLPPRDVVCQSCAQVNPFPELSRPVLLLADECHAFKTPSNERTRNWRGLRTRVWDSGGFVFGLTGTPCEGKPMEFWEVLVSLGLAKAAFGNWDNYHRIFKEWFSNPKGDRIAPSGELQQELHQRLRKVQIKRLRSQVLSQLPPRQEEIRYVDIDEKTIHDVNESVHQLLATKRAWDEVKAGLIVQGARLLDPYQLRLEPDERARRKALFDQRKEYYFRSRPWIIDNEIAEAVDQALMSKGQMPTIEELSKIRAMLSKAKIRAVQEWINDMEEQDEPIVLFSQHLSVLDKISNNRPGWGFFHGGLSARQRAAMVKEFQGGVIAKGLAVSLGAGGEGITLTRAATCGFVDLSWNPAKNQQGEARLIRIGAEQHDVRAAENAIKELGCGNCKMVDDPRATGGRRAQPCDEHKTSILVVRFVAKHVVDKLVMATLKEKEALLASLDWSEEEAA